MTQGDIDLFNTADGGDIAVELGVIRMTKSPRVSVYLSLFGGNVDDDGIDGSPLQWWGNVLETDEAARYRSRTQHQLSRLPATPNSLADIEDAARQDLGWMLREGAATSVDVSASIPAVNTVEVAVTLNGDETMRFAENWKAQL